MLRSSVMFAAALCGGLLALSPCVPAGAQSGGLDEPVDLPRRVAIRFMTDSDFPPFHYYDEEGVLTGFNVDIARAICLELGTACDIQVRGWTELLPALRRGETDALVASHAITPQLLREFDVTDRYYFTPARFVGRREGPPVAATTPEGLEGKRIGVARGSSHEAYLRTFFHNSAIVPFETSDLARDALRAGNGVDVVFGDGISLAFWINGTLSRACCEIKGGPFYEPKFFGDGIGIVVPRADAQLKGLINQALQRLRESGRYEELLLRYFPTRVF
ncbi:MAG: transporter substrate-binding domain-containing protein [Hyphomicrobiaceae bacterium]|nr:transporter substrate-binding domain-containing protein [Hyphomicrobiaceae bacterium]